MPEVQSSYPENQPVALVGMVANQESQNRITRLLEDVAALGFGKAVFRGAASNTCTATPAAGRFLGFSLLDAVQENDAYPSKKAVGIMAQGVIWVRNGAAAVAHGDQLYVTPAGAITNVAAGNVILPGVEADSSAAPAALLRVRVLAAGK